MMEVSCHRYERSGTSCCSAEKGESLDASPRNGCQLVRGPVLTSYLSLPAVAEGERIHGLYGWEKQDVGPIQPILYVLHIIKPERSLSRNPQDWEHP